MFNRPFSNPQAQLRSLVVICWLSLFSFVAIIRPILPFAEYALRKEYIANNLCKNKGLPELQCEGKCYFMQQIKKSQETAPNQDTPTNSRLAFSDYYFMNDSSLWSLPAGNQLQKESAYCLVNFYQSILIDHLAPPPQI